ncbi:unnamed protein product [Brassicogethes aeneus]|uniref:Protein LLP homolog n=1 Tax=Brassicogethes aeneus TaxID=1431903 RepID=A0A9P0AQS4_BRAAE|nr:unnamed protein product [Brassicogethes aeneus]
MAKSMRSKWRRKCRAVKRERYGKKELERLKKTLGIDDTKEEKDVQMKEVSEIVTFTTADKIKEKKKDEKDDMVTDVDLMDIKKKFNTRTLRNENGAYPVWVHPRKRKVTKNKKGNKKGKGKKN